MPTRRLQFDDGKSKKFWTISLQGSSHTVTFGRIGTQGQGRTKDFDTKEEAKKSYEELGKQKLGKGYVEAQKGSPSTRPERGGAVPSPSSVNSSFSAK